jgi:hypothetical protein
MVVRRLRELKVPTGLVSNADDRICESYFYFSYSFDISSKQKIPRPLMPFAPPHPTQSEPKPRLTLYADPKPQPQHVLHHGRSTSSANPALPRNPARPPYRGNDHLAIRRVRETRSEDIRGRLSGCWYTTRAGIRGEYGGRIGGVDGRG